MKRLRGLIREYFMEVEWSFSLAVVPFCFLSMLLYTRHPTKTNFIFDEQEALLANPYVHGVAAGTPIPWLDAFRRDFWGLTPDHTIGSYRPIPNILWRVLWNIGAKIETPFLQHWANVLLHGVNGACVAVVAFALTRERRIAWLSGSMFTATAVLTEAVTGVVGAADVLGGTGVLMGLLAITLSSRVMPIALFTATLFGLFSKETVLSMVPLVPLAAVVFADRLHPSKPRPALRGALAAFSTVGAFVIYVEARRNLFPTVPAPQLSVQANAAKPVAERAFAAILRWYAQPILPHDPLNNPLINATFPYRVGGALRVFVEGLGQVLLPRTLSGDYSAAQEEVPTHLTSAGVVVGAVGWVVLTVLGVVCLVRAGRPDAAHSKTDPWPIIGFFLIWMVVCYFPVSNIPILLPTIRAERFWYLPVIGSSIVLAIGWFALFTRVSGPRRYAWAVTLFICTLAMQCYAARRHADDYLDDLTFWNATCRAAPKSAKAHLNYSIMRGARGDLEGRLASNAQALTLAPSWPMANVYYGDTLCRMDRAVEAWPHYAHGFELSPNDVGLVALGIQCLWEKKFFESESPYRERMEEIATRYPGSWVAYLWHDVVEHGEDNDGVDPKYRPRRYNEGPK